MTEAVRVLRQSQGTEDSTSIQQQRESTRELAENLGLDADEDLRTIDLSDTTGFSAFYKGSDSDERIDTQPEIQRLVEDLRRGSYGYLIAHDDTRIARDSFFFVIEYSAIVGGCTLEFVEEPPENRLTFVVSRAATADAKHKEIKRSQVAVQERLENGYHQGAPPFGLRFDEEGEFLVRDSNEWPAVERVFELRSEDLSYRDIASEVEAVSISTVGNILTDNREKYLTRMNPDHPAVGD